MAGAIGFGLGYIWSYPIYAHIVIPCPGCDIDTPDIDIEPPVAIPHDELSGLGLDPSEYTAESLDMESLESDAIEAEAIEPDDDVSIEAVDVVPEMADQPMDMPVDEPVDIPDYGGMDDYGGDMDDGGDW
jgi:hypothetical protein